MHLLGRGLEKPLTHQAQNLFITINLKIMSEKIKELSPKQRIGGQTVKTIKTFKTIERLVEYANKIGYSKDTKEMTKEVAKNSLIKYGSVLMLFDPYGLID